MANWIDLHGVVNMRDVGGAPTTDGGRIARGVLLRSDNLQDLTADDLIALRELGVTDVIDLRTDVEVRTEGPGPMTGQPWARIHHHSYFIEHDHQPDSSAGGDGPEPLDTNEPEAGGAAGSVPESALPWVGKASSAQNDDHWAAHYLSYLVDRPDSVLAALRAIAGADGAALVHCAAGKDRTGTTVALALLLAGAEPSAVIADYAASTERVAQIVERLAGTRTYAANVLGRPLASHASPPETMQALIDHLARHGGVEAVLAEIGWASEDTARMRAKLREPQGRSAAS